MSYTGSLGKLPSDVDELVLQGFLFETQLFHGQRLVMVQLHLLMSCHQCFLQAVLEQQVLQAKEEGIIGDQVSCPKLKQHVNSPL